LQRVAPCCQLVHKNLLPKQVLYQAELCPDVWFSAAWIANRPLTDRSWQLLSKTVVFLFCFRLQVNPSEVHQGPPAASL
jgi:hypothetical protein